MQIVPLTSFPLILTCCPLRFVKAEKPSLVHDGLTPDFIWISPFSLPMPFFFPPVLESNSGYQMFADQASLISSGLRHFLLIALRGRGQVFCRMSISLGLSGVFLMTRLGLQVLGKKTAEMRCFSHHTTQGMHVLMWLITSDANPDRLVKMVSARRPL